MYSTKNNAAHLLYVLRIQSDAGTRWWVRRRKQGEEEGESFPCFSKSTERLKPALTSPLIPLKLNFNGLLLATALPRASVCITPHSHLPLQVERLVDIVVATAQVDEGRVAAGCHLLVVLLLQLEGALQVLFKQLKSQEKKQTSEHKKQQICRSGRRRSYGSKLKQILPPQHSEPEWVVWERCLMVCSPPSVQPIYFQAPTPFPQSPVRHRCSTNMSNQHKTSYMCALITP